jgi:hypothetical protein
MPRPIIDRDLPLQPFGAHSHIILSLAGFLGADAGAKAVLRSSVRSWLAVVSDEEFELLGELL